MSDQTNLDDNVDIPEASPEDFSSQEAKKSLSPAAKFGIVIGGVFLVIGGSLFIGRQEISDPTSSISVRADLDSTPGGAVQSESPRYQELLEQSNEQAAAEAAREGRTFIPTPERVLQNIEDLEAGNRIEEPEAVPEPEVIEAPVSRPAPVVVQAPPTPRVTNRPAVNTVTHLATDEQLENPYREAILRQMGALSAAPSKPSIRIADTGVADAAERRRAEAIERGGQPSPAGTGTGSSDAAGEVLVPAGDIIYAETLTSTNSDLSGSPVLVELTTGEHRGSKLIGDFTVNPSSDSMVIEFTSMTTPDGETYPVSAFAVDGMSAEVAVASDVNRRYLGRYGPILASAFITSYAGARSEPSQSLTTIGDDTAVIQDPHTTEQSLYAGLSAAAEAIGADMIANAPKGPKIILRDGWPIAVLFTTSVVAGN